MNNFLQTGLKGFVGGMAFMLGIVLVVYASSVALNELGNKVDGDNLTLSMWNSLVTHVQDLRTDVDTIELTPGPIGAQGPKGDKGDTGNTGSVGPQGPAGPVNISQSLTANRTDYVPSEAAVKTAVGLKADIASPNFTGTPTAPTPPLGDDTIKIATTQWVNANTVSASTQKSMFVLTCGMTYGSISPTCPNISGYTKYCGLQYATVGTRAESDYCNSLYQNNTHCVHQCVYIEN